MRHTVEVENVVLFLLALRLRLGGKRENSRGWQPVQRPLVASRSSWRREYRVRDLCVIPRRCRRSTVLPGGSTSPRKLMLNPQRVTRVLDTLIEAKLSQEQAGIMDSDFAAGYVTALEEVKVLLQLDRPSIR